MIFPHGSDKMNLYHWAIFARPLIVKRSVMSKNTLHAGELLFKKCLGGSPFHRQLFPLLSSPFSRLHRQPEISHLGSEKLVQQNIPGQGEQVLKVNLMETVKSTLEVL